MSLQGWATSKVVQLILVAIIAAGAAFFIGKAMDWRRDSIAHASMGRQVGAKVEATDGITKDGAKADTAKRGDETAVAAGRQTYNETMERAQREEPAIADRASRRVPDRVRDAARARRLARERSSRAEGER